MFLTGLIHHKCVPTTFGFAEVDPKGKAYYNPDYNRRYSHKYDFFAQSLTKRKKTILIFLYNCDIIKVRYKLLSKEDRKYDRE